VLDPPCNKRLQHPPAGQHAPTTPEAAYSALDLEVVDVLKPCRQSGGGPLGLRLPVDRPGSLSEPKSTIDSGISTVQRGFRPYFVWRARRRSAHTTTWQAKLPPQSSTGAS
jgi:hypothetical protein